MYAPVVAIIIEIVQLHKSSNWHTFDLLLYFAFLIVTPLAVPEIAISEKYFHSGSISTDMLLSIHNP